jgi:UDP-glucuronate 4-epimerase
VDHGRVLVTGAAGFIGAAVAGRLLDEGREVVGVDDLNDYYSPRLKRARLARLEGRAGFRFVEGDVADADAVTRTVDGSRPGVVVHLAAQAGIRRALHDPYTYGRTNLMGFLHVAEASARAGVGHLLYASTSSVYGLNRDLPYRESDPAQHPVSLYSATKIANEAIAHSYASVHGLASTGMRFFTVYGPWGRPDMAPIKFARAILAGEEIELYNGGDHSRDFTYVDDIVDAVVALAALPAAGDAAFDARRPRPTTSSAPWRVVNVGGEHPVALREFVAALERALGRGALVRLADRQRGDMDATAADCAELRALTGWRARVGLDEGLARLAEWCRAHPELLA